MDRTRITGTVIRKTWGEATASTLLSRRLRLCLFRPLPRRRRDRGSKCISTRRTPSTRAVISRRSTIPRCWAIQSRNAGNQNGKALEAQIVGIYKTQVKQLFLQQNYPAALQLNAAMQSYYPGDQGLLQDQQKILAAANGRQGGYQAPVNGQVPGAPYPPGYPPQYQPRPGTRPPTSHP